MVTPSSQLNEYAEAEIVSKDPFHWFCCLFLGFNFSPAYQHTSTVTGNSQCRGRDRPGCTSSVVASAEHLRFCISVTYFDGCAEKLLFILTHNQRIWLWKWASGEGDRRAGSCKQPLGAMMPMRLGLRVLLRLCPCSKRCPQLRHMPGIQLT